MGKLEEMMRGAGANAGESMGEGRRPGAVHGAPPAPFGGVPARLQGVAKAKDAAEIPVEKIQPDPDQPREEFDPEALDRLAESLKARGQLQPIRVRWDEGRGAYVIVAGERRWRAAVKAGLKAMACVIHDGAIAPGELLALQLVENLMREDLRPIEQARAFRSLMDLNGWSVRQLARELAIDHTGAVRALALLELPESVQSSVERGTLPPATAYELSKVPDPDAQRDLAARVVTERLSRAETVEAVHRAVGRPAKGKGRGGKARKVTSRTLRTSAGRVTVENGRGLTPELLRAALAEALASVDAEAGAGGQAAA
jgi:ParB family chromosome partitioning protein